MSAVSLISIDAVNAFQRKDFFHLINLPDLKDLAGFVYISLNFS